VIFPEVRLYGLMEDFERLRERHKTEEIVAKFQLAGRG
jgi:hypothetical protein